MIRGGVDKGGMIRGEGVCDKGGMIRVCVTMGG